MICLYNCYDYSTERPSVDDGVIMQNQDKSGLIIHDMFRQCLIKNLLLDTKLKTSQSKSDSTLQHKRNVEVPIISGNCIKAFVSIKIIKQSLIMIMNYN